MLKACTGAKDVSACVCDVCMDFPLSVSLIMAVLCFISSSLHSHSRIELGLESNGFTLRYTWAAKRVRHFPKTGIERIKEWRTEVGNELEVFVQNNYQLF